MANNKYTSLIAIPFHVSESEIAFLFPDYDYSWVSCQNNRLKKILFDLGLNSNSYFVFQDVTQHRNRFNNVVTCGRFFGEERTDKNWIESGKASQAVKDKIKNSAFLDDLYRRKGLTVDVQKAMEERDKYYCENNEKNDDTL